MELEKIIKIIFGALELIITFALRLSEKRAFEMRRKDSRNG